MTIAGFHSVAELKELVKAKDFDIAQVQNDADAFVNDWRQGDLARASQWMIDWVAFRDRYRLARAAAMLTIGAAATAPVPDAMIPAEPQWDLVLRALRADESRVAPTDFQGLYTRLVAARGEQTDFSGQPQPTGIEDADLRFFKATEPIAHLVDDTRVTFGNPLVIGALAGGAVLLAGILLRR